MKDRLVGGDQGIGRGRSAASQGNLRPRRRFYDEPKKRREIMVTDAGMAGLRAVAAAHECSVSELAERIGRGKLQVVSVVDVEVSHAE